MVIENPEGQTNNADEEKPVLSDELLKALDDGTKKVDDLDTAQKNALFDLLKEQKDEDPEKIEGDPAPAADKDIKKDPEPEPEKDAVVTPIASKAEHQKLSDEANRYEQKTKAARARVEKSKEDWEAIKKKEHEIKGDVDPVEENEFKDFVKETKLANLRLTEEVGFLREKLSEKDQLDAEDYSSQAENAREKSIYAAISDLQEGYEDLQTKTPFKTMNKDWGTFLDKLVKKADLKAEDLNLPEGTDATDVNQGLRDKALAVYHDDEAFKEEAQKLLPKSLQDQAEMKKYEIIVGLYERSQKPATLKAAWLESLEEKGILKDSIGKIQRDALIKGSNLAANSISNKSPNTIQPDDGPGVSPSNAKGEMSMEVARSVVQATTEKLKNGHLNDEEKEAHEKAMEVLTKAMSVS